MKVTPSYQDILFLQCSCNYFCRWLILSISFCFSMQNAFLSALPYLGGWAFSVISGVVADSLLEKELLSVTAVRKIFTITGKEGTFIFKGIGLGYLWNGLYQMLIDWLLKRIKVCNNFFGILWYYLMQLIFQSLEICLLAKYELTEFYILY